MAISLIKTEQILNTGGGTTGGSKSLTLSAGSDKLLVVMVASDEPSGYDIEQIKYNGVSLTQATERRMGGGDTSTNIFYLVDPATGTNSLQWITEGDDGDEVRDIVMYAFELDGVDQDNPIDDSTSGSGDGSCVPDIDTSHANSFWFVSAASEDTSPHLRVGGGDATEVDYGNFGAQTWYLAYRHLTTAGSYTIPDQNSTDDEYVFSSVAFREGIAVAQYNVSHSTDVHAKDRFTNNHSTDVSIASRGDQSHSTNTHLYVAANVEAVSHTTDTKMKGTESQSHTTDVILRSVDDINHTTDVSTKITEEQSHSTDTSKIIRGNPNHSTDVYATVGITDSFDTWSSLASTDDAEEALATGNMAALDDSTVAINDEAVSGFRIRNVSIAQGATIDEAIFYVDELQTFGGGALTGVTLYGEDIDDSPAFTTANSNISSRTRTTANVTGIIGNSSQFKNGIDVTAIVQEIVNRGGWSSGNDMTFIFVGDEGGGSFASIYSYDAFTDGTYKTYLKNKSGTTGSAREMRRQHATDVYLTAANPPVTLDEEHTTDVLSRDRFTVQHSTDAFSRERDDKDHTTNTYLRKINSVSHGTDTIANSRVESEHNTDILLRNSQTASHSADGFLRASGGLTQSTDSYLRKVNSSQHLTDVYTNIKVNTDHDTNTFLRATDSLNQSTDTLLRYRNSESHDVDIYLRDKENFTYEDIALPSGIADLANSFTPTQYAQVEDFDSVYMVMSAGGTAVILMKYEHDNDDDAVNVSWRGKSTLATSVNPMRLEVYNFDTSSWELKDADTTSAGDANIELTTSIGVDVENYYDANNKVVARVYQVVA